MKKPTIIALVVLGVLALALLLVLNSSGREAKEPEYAIPSLKEADKISIVDGEKKATLIKKGDTWELSEPVSFPVEASVVTQLKEVLDKDIKADLTRPEADAATYEINEGAPKVTFSKGDSAIVTLTIGKEQTVKNTGVKRTWVKPEDRPEVYRATAGLRTVLVRDPEKWRAKKLGDFEEKDAKKLEIAYADKKLVFAPQGEGEAMAWNIVEPAGIKIDQNAVKRLVGSIGRLRADGFADGVEPATAGVDKPEMTLTVTVEGRDEPFVVKLGSAVPAEAPTGEDAKPNPNPDRYIQLGGADWIYEVKSWSYKNIAKRLGDLRDKQMLNVDKASVSKLTWVDGAGEKGDIVVAKEGEAWKMTAPEAKDVPTPNVDKVLRFLATGRAKNIPDDVTADAAGLVPEEGAKQKALVVTKSDGSVLTLNLGKEVDEKSKDLYARVGEDGLVFTIASWNAKNLTPSVEDLTKEPPAAPPGGMPPGGMPGGLPGGLPPGLKLGN